MSNQLAASDSALCGVSTGHDSESWIPTPWVVGRGLEVFRDEGPGKASSDLRASGAWRASPNTCLQGLCSSRPAAGRAEASREGQKPGSAPRVGPLPFPPTYFFRRLTGSTSQPEAALPEDGGPFAQLCWGLCCCLGPPQQSPTCSWQAPAEEPGTAPMSPPVPETSFLWTASLGVIPHRQTLGRAFRVLCRKPPVNANGSPVARPGHPAGKTPWDAHLQT